jgi:DAK2 domain fusion protein YloV
MRHSLNNENLSEVLDLSQLDGVVVAPVENLTEQGFYVEENVLVAGTGTGLENLLSAGQQWLETHVDLVNNLNVFPVPDGDTGTNMLLTLRAATEQMDRAADRDVSSIAQAAAYGALMGARGNSGVILSQFLQGIALGLTDKTFFTAVDLAQAVELGVVRAYQSVIEPVEGTILTVARAAAEAAGRCAGNSGDLVVVLSEMVAAAKAALASTPELLPILKEAGVVDAGGQGLVYILEGGLRWLQDAPLDDDLAGEIVPGLQSTLGVDEQAYGYDVQFLIQGDRLDVEQIRAEVNRMGQSVLVVGDEQLVKVHVHTPDPGAPISYTTRLGVISQVVVEDLTVQAREFVRGRAVINVDKKSASGPKTGIGLVTVSPGQGLAEIFRSLGVSRVLTGGQVHNPSTQDLLEVVNQVEAAHVLILPNNGNVILAAQQVSSLSDKSVRVIPTKTIPQGIAALLAFNYQADLETNERRMLEAARQVQSLEVTRAVRASRLNGLTIQSGDVIGLLNNELTSFGQTYDEVVIDLLRKIELGSYEILTIYFGQDASLNQAETLAEKISTLFPELEVEIHSGGQPHYQYILSLE